MSDTGDLTTRRAFTPVMHVFTLGETGAKEKLLLIPIPIHQTRPEADHHGASPGQSHSFTLGKGGHAIVWDPHLRRPLCKESYLLILFSLRWIFLPTRAGQNGAAFPASSCA